LNIITAFLEEGTKLVLNGYVDIVKEDRLGRWQLLEVTSDCSKLIFPTYDRANYMSIALSDLRT
jgi:hypothetical protein